MSSYIDAEWLEENAKQYSLGYYDDDEWATPLNVLDSAPSIDIVRCGECKHRKPSGYVGFVKTYECDITGLRMHDLTNHFCSYGEREGE